MEVFGKKPVTSSEFPVVFFDAGGVLLHYAPTLEEAAFHAISGPHSISQSVWTRAVVDSVKSMNEESETNEEFSRTSTQFIEDIYARLNISDAKLVAKKLRDEFFQKSRVVLAQSTLDLCEELVDRGYRLGIISNWEGSLHELLRVEGILDLFESVITAHEMGFSKPQREIFEAACIDFEIQPEEAILVGSSYAFDIVGARRVGMKAIIYDPQYKELAALSPEEVSGKVVSLDKLRHNRYLQDVRVITKLQEVLDLCQ